MKFARNLFLIVSILLLFTPSLFAQRTSGQILGIVSDSSTGEILIGANVTLKGTSLGAATNVDGKYVIMGIPPGSYTLVVRYIGYRLQEIPVEVTEGSRQELDISLLSEAIETGIVVVTAQAKGQRDAINQQLTSDKIINVVSAEKIHQLPDANAATALSRLPGVSLMNGDQVVIRGVQAKLNQVLVNGIELPSTDMNNRATNLGFISSNLLSGIEVVKAVTPDMDANTIGGVVNLRLREAPSGLHFDALAQGNYNSTDRVSDNYKFWASVSNRFFNDKLGVFLQGNMDGSDGGNQIASINLGVYGDLHSSEIGQRTFVPNSASFQYAANIVKTSGGSLILDYQLPHGKIVLQNTYAGNVTDQLNNYININFNPASVVFTPDRSKYGKDLWINALQFENTLGILKVEASLSHSATQQYTMYGYSPGINGAGWSQFGYASSWAPFGIDPTTNRPRSYVNIIAQGGMTFDRALEAFNNLSPAEGDSATIQGWIQSIANQFRQHLYNATLDFSAPVNFSPIITATFKAGGKFVRTTRENNIDELFAKGIENLYRDQEANDYLGVGPARPVRLSDVMNKDFARGQYYLNSLYNFTNGGYKYTLDRNRYDTWLKLSQRSWLNPLQQADSYRNDWSGSEEFSAGYLMGTFNLGPKWTVLGGVRFENYRMIYHAQFTFITHTVYGDCVTTADGSLGDTINPVRLYHNVPYNTFNVDRTDNNVFPGVQIQYKVTDWSDLRFAYTTGISRPDYTSIIPKIAFNAANIELGNPLLKPATVRNIDAVASLHSNTLGLLTINGFYKEIKNQMYNTSIYYMHRAQFASAIYIPDSLFMAQRFGFSFPLNQTIGVALNNPNLGYIRGVEIDWQTVFWYLPRPLNALVLDVNYTHSGSNTVYRILRPESRIVIDPITHRPTTVYTTKDTVYNGRLIQQANDVVNVALGIDYKGFSGRISFSMTGNVINSVGATPEESSFTGNIYRWDFTVKQNLPIKGLSLSLNGINIFHNGVNTYRNYRQSTNAPVTENLVSVLYSPTIFEANLRYNF